MVFGLFNALETFFGFVFYFIPYWDWIRLLLFVWLLLPNFNGSKVLYDGVIRKLLDQNKDLIQKWISKVSSAANDAKTKAAQQAKQAASDPGNMANLMSAASQA